MIDDDYNNIDEKLELFLLKIEDVQEEFIELCQNKGYDLDYSLGSLQILEDFILNEKISLEEDKVDIRGDCWIYLGEVVCKNLNGYWTISNSEENSINNGLFVVTGHAKEGIEYVPSRIIRAFIMRKKNNFLLQSIMSQISFEQLKLESE